MQCGCRPRFFAANLARVEIIRPRAVLQEQLDRLQIMEIHRAQERVGAFRVSPGLEQHAQPVVMTQFS